MIIVKDLKGLNRKPDFIILTGDGKWEYKVLKGLAKKYPCNRADLILFYPESPLVLKKGKSIYEAVSVYVDRYKVYKFLVLYDNEYHKNFNEDLEILKKEVGIKIKNYKIIKDRILYVSGKLGSHDIEIYTSVQGYSKSGERKGLNEEIAKLIKLKFGVNVSNDHKEIKRFLKSQNMDITKLIESSGDRYLKKAITLYIVLKMICKNFIRIISR